MTTRMSTAKLLAMADKRYGDSKRPLLGRAREMENTSPEPRHAIHMWDTKIDWREKTRLGINFNRSVTMSLESRWEVVNKLTVEFLREVISLNEQLSEEAGKHARQLLTLILTRTKRLGMASRIEQMAGLLMHITFYRTVLKAKAEEMQESTSFLFHCSELMGFTHPTQIMDRHIALKACLTEIREEYDIRVKRLARLQEFLTEYVESCLKNSLMLHNQMASLHVRLKELRQEIIVLERFVEEKEQQEAEAVVRRRKIKASVHHCYTAMMNYKGLEHWETNLVKQMEDFGIRLSNTINAVRIVEEERNAKEKAAAEVAELSKSRHHSIADTGSLSKEDEHDSEAEFDAADKTRPESNKSSNWRPGLGGNVTSTPYLISKACDVLSRFKGGNDEDSQSAVNMPLRSYNGDARVDRLVQDNKGMQAFRSICALNSMERQGQRKDELPRGGSILDTISETGRPYTQRAHSVAAGARLQYPLDKRYGTFNSKQGSVNRFSQREHGLQPLKPKGASSNASLDRSFNKSVQDYKTPNLAVGARTASDRDVLPIITPGFNTQAKRSSSSNFHQADTSTMKSVTSVASLARMSERMRSQLNDVRRLHYLASPPGPPPSTMGEDYWDDGVFVSAPPRNKRSRKQGKKKTLTSAQSSSTIKESKQGNELKGKRPTDPHLYSESRSQMSPSVFEDAFSDHVGLEDSIGSPSKQNKKRSPRLRSPRKAETQPLDHHTTTEPSNESTRLPPVNSQSAETGLKRPAQKWPVTKRLSSSKVLSQFSKPTKSYRPALRRPGSLVYQRGTPVHAPLPTAYPADTNRLSAPKSNAGKLIRKLCQKRNLKRDCLSILANVKLGSRWAENES